MRPYGTYGGYGLSADEVGAYVDLGTGLLPALGEGLGKVVQSFKPSDFQAVNNQIAALEAKVRNMSPSNPAYTSTKLQLEKLRQYRDQMVKSAGAAAEAMKVSLEVDKKKASADELASKAQLIWAGGGALALTALAVGLLIYLRD